MGEAVPETRKPVYSRGDEEAFYWVGKFCKHGMTLSQAERLAFESRCDRHAVLEQLNRGCDPSVAFDIYS